MKLNIGCGQDQPAGWVNADKDSDLFAVDVVNAKDVPPPRAGGWYADLAAQRLPWPDASFDIAVANHVLSDIGHHDLPHALGELLRVLAPGGVLRVLVPDIDTAISAWEHGRREWFPQDERVASIDARFCTFVTWFGESRSVFTCLYLTELLHAAGFDDTAWCGLGRSYFLPPDSGITDLDGDRTTALIMEARRW